MQRFSFFFRHKFGVENKVADALSRRVTLLSVMSTKVIGFEKLQEEYESCPDFGEVYTKLRTEHLQVIDDFILRDGYLFKAKISFVSPAHQLETFWFGKCTREDFQGILDVIRQLKR